MILRVLGHVCTTFPIQLLLIRAVDWGQIERFSATVEKLGIQLSHPSACSEVCGSVLLSSRTSFRLSESVGGIMGVIMG